jgi:hypothetical protein
MNQRITELMLEAGKIIPGDKHIDADFCEKFAELIVRECAMAADEGLAQVTMKVEWPSYHIKKHFGVEE